MRRRKERRAPLVRRARSVPPVPPVLPGQISRAGAGEDVSAEVKALAASVARAIPGGTYPKIVDLALRKLAFDLPDSPDTPSELFATGRAPVLVHFPERQTTTAVLGDNFATLEGATRFRKRVTMSYQAAGTERDLAPRRRSVRPRLPRERLVPRRLVPPAARDPQLPRRPQEGRVFIDLAHRLTRPLRLTPAEGCSLHDDRSAEILIDCEGFEWVTGWVLGVGRHAWIVGPDEARAALLDRLDRVKTALA